MSKTPAKPTRTPTPDPASDANHPPISPLERWLQRITLLLMAIFTALGVYVLYYPSETLIAIFGTLGVVTLLSGVLTGILAIYSS